MRSQKPILFLSLIVAVFVLVLIMFMRVDLKKNAALPDFVYDDHYFAEVKKVFDTRCVACHACYNSPCQLNLTSYDGVVRGASSMDPYDFPMLEANPSTRLGIDAQDEAGWRKLGFFPVIHTGKNNSETEKPKTIADSLLLQVIHGAPEVVNTKLTYTPEESRICPSTRVGADYLRQHGMPFGLPKLEPEQIQTITAWVLSGAKGPNAEAAEYLSKAHSEDIQKEIKEWESILNKQDYKHQLSARYFYEHLFSAHISFQEDHNEFFRIVRAKNLKGFPEEIATTRPFDDPKTKEVYYRFKKVNETIVHKSHTVFVLNSEKLETFKQDFLNAKWEKEEAQLPGYSAEAANAFLVFKNIPVQARYKFFLENARYFIMTFMKGPVCRGQTALNVINDHFWVMFVDPKSDITMDAKYFSEMGHLLSPPATQKNQIDLFNKAKENRWQAAQIKMRKLSESGKTLGMDSIWKGYGSEENPNALLTVYRHFDSSNVLYGAHGTIPKTIWLMDYQIFEDIYYNLVAGYNVFGPVLHQINTRLYMDISRIESEDMFISLMPASSRKEIRQQWTQPSQPKKDSIADKILAKVEDDFITKVKFDYKYAGDNIKSSFQAKTSDPKSEFLRKLMHERFENQVFYKSPDVQRKDLKEELTVDLGGFMVSDATFNALNSLNGVAHKFVKAFPDVTFLWLTNDQGQSKAFTIVRNKFHYNVSLLFFEDQRRKPDKDTLDVLPLYAASYPNYFLKLDEAGVQNLVEQLYASQEYKDHCQTLKSMGVNRDQKSFWKLYDQFNEDFKSLDPIESGIFDLNRYQDACQNKDA